MLINGINTGINTLLSPSLLPPPIAASTREKDGEDRGSSETFGKDRRSLSRPRCLTSGTGLAQRRDGAARGQRTRHGSLSGAHRQRATTPCGINIPQVYPPAQSPPGRRHDNAAAPLPFRCRRSRESAPGPAPSGDGSAAARCIRTT